MEFSKAKMKAIQIPIENSFFTCFSYLRIECEALIMKINGKLEGHRLSGEVSPSQTITRDSSVTSVYDGVLNHTESNAHKSFR